MSAAQNIQWGDGVTPDWDARLTCIEEHGERVFLALCRLPLAVVSWLVAAGRGIRSLWKRVVLAWPRPRLRLLENRVRLLEGQQHAFERELEILREGGGIRYPIKIPDPMLEAAVERKLRGEARGRAERLLTTLASTKRPNPARR